MIIASYLRKRYEHSKGIWNEILGDTSEHNGTRATRLPQSELNQEEKGKTMNSHFNSSSLNPEMIIHFLQGKWKDGPGKEWPSERKVH
jgi:hypothetical protein